MFQFRLTLRYQTKKLTLQFKFFFMVAKLILTPTLVGKISTILANLDSGQSSASHEEMVILLSVEIGHC